jgi:hypothetical protein
MAFTYICSTQMFSFLTLLHIQIFHLPKPYLLLFPYASVSQPPDRGPVPGPGINYTGLREVHLEFVILVF